MRMGKIDRAVLLAAVSQQPQAKKQLRQLANAIRDDARALAPRDSGNLRRSITVVNHYDPVTKTVEYRVGWNPAIAFYGWMIEAGTENTPPQPHLRPAARKHGGVPPAGG